MTKKTQMPVDTNSNPVPAIKLSDPQDIDGSLASAQSAAIDGSLVRICALGANIRFLIGTNPTALATSHFLAAYQEIWMPCDVGDKVAVIGGVAHISTAGV